MLIFIFLLKIFASEITYLSALKNLQDYDLFANAGWDGNWFIGFNTCWIVKLPSATTAFERAFLGAKIGRAKTTPIPSKPPWERQSIPGEIYIAVSSTPAWSLNQSFLLTKLEDIPIESDSQNAVNNIGEARWFWVEVPAELINTEGDNFVALWSPTPYLNTVSSCPILAAGWGKKETSVWLNNEIEGVPPRDASDSLKTKIFYFEPAIAIKLVLKNSEPPTLKVSWSDDSEKYYFNVYVTGNNIRCVFIELSYDRTVWERFGRYIWSSPYVFSLDKKEVTQLIKIRPSNTTIYLRFSAIDEFENKGSSPELIISQ